MTARHTKGSRHALLIALAGALLTATAGTAAAQDNERYRWRTQPPPATAEPYPADALTPAAPRTVRRGVNELPAITVQAAAPKRVTGEKARARRLVRDNRRPLSSDIPGSRDVLLNLQYHFLESDEAARLDCNGQPVRITDVFLDGVHPYEGVTIAGAEGAPAIRYHRAIAYFRGIVDPIDMPVCGGETEISAELLLVRLVDKSLGDSWFAPAWRRSLVQQ